MGGEKTLGANETILMSNVAPHVTELVIPNSGSFAGGRDRQTTIATMSSRMLTGQYFTCDSEACSSPAEARLGSRVAKTDLFSPLPSLSLSVFEDKWTPDNSFARLSSTDVANEEPRAPGGVPWAAMRGRHIFVTQRSCSGGCLIAFSERDE